MKLFMKPKDLVDDTGRGVKINIQGEEYVPSFEEGSSGEESSIDEP